MQWVPFGKRPKTLPTVLSHHEVDKLIQCTANRKHRTFLMTLYSGGLRFSEGANLRIADIDSDRMMIRIACGKGRKERLVPLSPRLLKELRIYWKQYRPTDLLFPGKSKQKTYADTTIQKTIKVAAIKAGIKKRVYPHEPLRNDEDWGAFIEKLESKKWVAYIQPPPSESSSANQVVRYLTRYLTGGPISDRRIRSADSKEVTFMAREGARTGGERNQVPVTLRRGPGDTALFRVPVCGSFEAWMKEGKTR